MILPNTDHFVRYCKPTQIQEGRVLSKAFVLKAKDTTSGLSGHHYEYNKSDYSLVFKSLISSGYKLPKNGTEGCFAKLNCGEVVTSANTANNPGKITFEKEDEKQSHTLMVGLIQDDEFIPELLVSLIKEIQYINSMQCSVIPIYQESVAHYEGKKHRY